MGYKTTQSSQNRNNFKLQSKEHYLQDFKLLSWLKISLMTFKKFNFLNPIFLVSKIKFQNYKPEISRQSNGARCRCPVVQVLPVSNEVDDQAEDEHADRNLFHASHQTTSTLRFYQKSWKLRNIQFIQILYLSTTCIDFSSLS